MTAGRRQLLVLAMAIGLVAAACTSGDDAGGRTDQAGDWWVENCGAVSELAHPADSPRIDPEIVIIDRSEGDLPERARDVLGRAGAEPRDLIELVTDPRRHRFPEEFGRQAPDAYVEALGENSLFKAVAGRVAVFEVEAESSDELVTELLGLDVVASPMHLVGYMSHWGAYPGTVPETCELGGEARPTAPPGEKRRVGVVDTGLLPGSAGAGIGTFPGDELDAHLGPCGASHGEFIVNVIRRANPAATVVSANAFAWQDACWETSEAQVVAATALLIGASTEADGTVGLDAVNFSLGAEGHELSTAMSVEPVLLRVTFEELIAALAASGTEVYAAAGNSPPDPNRPIYPAAYDGVIGVGATDSLDRPTVWDHSTPITGFTPGVWMDFGAPGCDLVAVATTAGLVAAADGHPEEVVLWSGSSFASPIAAAIGATSDVPQAQFAGVLYPDPPSPEVSQCATE